MGLWGVVKNALNSTVGTNDFFSLDKLLMKLRNESTHVYDTPGTYTLAIPDYVSKIKVTACAGGGGGAGNRTSASSSRVAYGSQGGAGGDFIADRYFDVTPSSNLSITVGAGGAGSTGADLLPGAGKNGDNTIIGSLITLVGGKGGSYDGGTNFSLGNGGNGGAGGNKSDTSSTVANPAEDGENTICASGGRAGGMTGNLWVPGGGGGASLGNGGNGANTGTSSSAKKSATNGTMGGGGGGGHSAPPGGSGGTADSGGNGGDGYVRIEW